MATETGIPIVFLHNGWAKYVEYALTLAKVRNPTSPVILLHDGQAPELKGIEQYRWEEFASGVNEFMQVYVHYSQYAEAFESFCFTRWIILQNFLRAKGYPYCFHADSDVLIFDDLTEAGRSFAHFDASLSFGEAGWCGHSAYINNLTFLDAFNRYVFTVFSQGEEAIHDVLRAELLLKNRGVKREHGPVNDMYLLGRFFSYYEFMIHNTANIENDATFDHFIGSPQSGFAMEDDHKAFQWRDGVPYCQHLRLHRPIRFRTAHYQGGRKSLLQSHFDAAMSKRTNLEG